MATLKLVVGTDPKDTLRIGLRDGMGQEPSEALVQEVWEWMCQDDDDNPAAKEAFRNVVLTGAYLLRWENGELGVKPRE